MTSEMISGILGILIGGFIGHRLAIGRDIRKEYNSTIQPLRLSIMKAVEDMKNGYAWRSFSDNDIDAVKNILTNRKRSKLNVLIDEYWKANEKAHKPDGCGGQEIIVENVEHVIEASLNIRKFVKPK